MTKSEQINEIATAIERIEIGDDVCFGDVFQEYVFREIAEILWNGGYVKNESEKIKYLEQQIKEKDDRLRECRRECSTATQEARMFREQREKLTFALAQMTQERDNAVNFAKSVGRAYLKSQERKDENSAE